MSVIDKFLQIPNLNDPTIPFAKQIAAKNPFERVAYEYCGYTLSGMYYPYQKSFPFAKEARDVILNIIQNSTSSLGSDYNGRVFGDILAKAIALDDNEVSTALLTNETFQRIIPGPGENGFGHCFDYACILGRTSVAKLMINSDIINVKLPFQGSYSIVNALERAASNLHTHIASLIIDFPFSHLTTEEKKEKNLAIIQEIENGQTELFDNLFSDQRVIKKLPIDGSTSLKTIFQMALMCGKDKIAKVVLNGMPEEERDHPERWLMTGEQFMLISEFKSMFGG